MTACCEYLQENIGRIKVGCPLRGTQRYTEAHKCEKKERCLPNWKPNKEDLLKFRSTLPESSIYTICCFCSEYYPKNSVK